MTRQEIKTFIKNKFPSLRFKGDSPDGKFLQWKDAEGQTRIRIDPPDNITRYHHIHLYDYQGNSLDINLEIKPYNTPDVHIPIKSD